MYLIAGGPSLQTFPWAKLSDQPCLAITRSFTAVPWAEVLYFTDARFWEWYHSELRHWRGRMITAARRNRINPAFPGLEHYKLTRASGLDTREGCLCHGNNSGYAAINLAYHLGAKEIFLLGYDMRFRDGRSHWHEGHPVKNSPNIIPKMLRFYDSLRKPLEEVGVKVWNACREPEDSELMTFHKIAWEELPCW